MSVAKRGYEGRASFGVARALKQDGPEGRRGTILIPVITEAEAAKKAEQSRARVSRGRKRI